MLLAPLWFNVLVVICFIVAVLVEMRNSRKAPDSSSEEEENP